MVKRVFATSLMGWDEDGGQSLSAEQAAELGRCRSSFRYFLPYWTFVNREMGTIQTFDSLWPGQQQLAELMETKRRIFGLKAGKLGFTELACAFDGWVARFGPPNARIHLYSRDARAAEELLGYVRFGLTRLPTWMQLPFAEEVSGSDTRDSLKLRAGADDIRRVVSYAAGPHVGIDQTATHVHVDELAHMPSPDRTWSTIQSTLAPDGTCHIVTRGAGDDNFTARLWEAAEGGASELTAFFAPWNARPDRDPAWREVKAETMPYEGLLRFAPESPADALAGDITTEYIPVEVWDRCHDPTLPPLAPGDRTRVVLGVDAGVTRDAFAVVAVSRHPQRHEDPAIRACRLWTPAERGGHIDFDEVERFIRFVCQGGCRNRHPSSMPHPECPECRSGSFHVPKQRVVQIAYDEHQLVGMMQRLERDRIAWCRPFPQTRERLIADSLMHMLALRGTLAHNRCPELRAHITNARAKLSPDEDSKLRVIKKGPSRKIDLVVAASMAVREALRLNI